MYKYYFVDVLFDNGLAVLGEEKSYLDFSEVAAEFTKYVTDPACRNCVFSYYDSKGTRRILLEYTRPEDL